MTVNEKMKFVIDLAEQALEKNELPIACIIFYNDTIITQSHTSESKDKRLLVHAEIKALLELDKKRINAKEKAQMELFTNLEPCMMRPLTVRRNGLRKPGLRIIQNHPFVSLSLHQEY